MKRERFFLIPIALLSSQLSQADAAQLKICRRAGIYGLTDNKTVVIPAQSSFAEATDSRGNGGDRFEIVLQETVKLPPKPGCVVGKAKIVKNTTGGKLTAKSGVLIVQFNLPGTELVAQIVD